MLIAGLHSLAIGDRVAGDRLPAMLIVHAAEPNEIEIEHEIFLKAGVCAA